MIDIQFERFFQFQAGVFFAALAQISQTYQAAGLGLNNLRRPFLSKFGKNTRFSAALKTFSSALDQTIENNPRFLILTQFPISHSLAIEDFRWHRSVGNRFFKVFFSFVSFPNGFIWLCG